MESGNLRRALKAKSHLSVENANLRAEIERLRATLESLLLVCDDPEPCMSGGERERRVEAARVALKRPADD